MTRVYRKPLFVALAATVLAGCDSDNDTVTTSSPPPPAMATLEVTVTNLTNAQPLSPVGIVAHTDGYAVFAIGDAIERSKFLDGVAQSTVNLYRQFFGEDRTRTIAKERERRYADRTERGAERGGDADGSDGTVMRPPAMRPGEAISRMTDNAVTDLPQPLSPTSPNVLPLGIISDTSFTALTTPSSV